jgi:hypothetical protein
VATTNSQGDPSAPENQGPIPREGRISRDQARELKKVAQTAYGFAAGERRLREDLGLEVGTPITLMRLEAHVSPERYAALIQTYEGDLKAAVEADVPDHPPPSPPVEAPAEGVTGPPPESTPVDNQRDAREAVERQRWGSLSRRSMAVGLSPSVWESLRVGDYQVAETMIAALEPVKTAGAEGRASHG